MLENRNDGRIVALDKLTKEVRKIRKEFERYNEREMQNVEDAILQNTPLDREVAALKKDVEAVSVKIADFSEVVLKGKPHLYNGPLELCPMCNLETDLDTPLREAQDDLEELRQAAQEVYNAWPGNRTLMSEAMRDLGAVLKHDCPDCGNKPDHAHMSDCSWYLDTP